VRAGDFTRIREDDGILTGFEILDLDPDVVPSREQMKEIWFTFNSLANFLRLPALFTDSPDRLRNAIQWLTALQTAYADNPSITSLLHYLMWRLDEASKTEIEAMRALAQEKFDRLEYWRHRDREFHFSALLDHSLPPIDPRATEFLADRGVVIGDQLPLSLS
jgi:hypothetical protein